MLGNAVLTVNIRFSDVLFLIEAGGCIITNPCRAVAAEAVAVCIDEAFLLGTTGLANTPAIDC
jgi:hypothetical protein